MRVLQLGPYPPPHGGVQSNLVAIRSFLRKRGIYCGAINITRNRKPDADDVYYPKSAAQLIKLLLQLKYDILHLHLGGMLTNRLLALSLVCTSLPGKKSVLTFHSGGYPSSPEGRAARPASFCGFVLRHFDRLIGVNSEIINFFHQVGVDSSRTRLIYPHALLAQEAGPGTFPEPLASFFETHDPVLISVGLLEPEYDLPLQIEVLGKIRNKNPRAGLVLIGSGSLELNLRSKIGAKPYAEHILLCGDVPHKSTLEAISRSSMMLRTTLYDGDAVSVREALYLSVPVIASDNGMRPQGVRLIPSSNLKALQQSIEKVLAEPAVERNTQFTADESNLQAVFELYQDVIERRT
jgi:glycosyltransferase involved in cell wall biosynthesis